MSYNPILWMSKIRPKQAKALAPDYRASGLLSRDGDVHCFFCFLFFPIYVARRLGSKKSHKKCT